MGGATYVRTCDVGVAHFASNWQIGPPSLEAYLRAAAQHNG